MAELSKTDQRRITFLSLLSSASNTIGNDIDGVYQVATEWLGRMEEDGFFSGSNPTPQRSERSARPASNTRPSNSGNRNSQPFTGQMRDPDGPPSEKQVALLLQLTEDYTEDEVWNMSKKRVSDLISDLKN